MREAPPRTGAHTATLGSYTACAWQEQSGTWAASVGGPARGAVIHCLKTREAAVLWYNTQLIRFASTGDGHVAQGQPAPADTNS